MDILEMGCIMFYRYNGYPSDRLSVIHAPDRVISGDSPATVVRRKPNSSIVVGLELQKAGKADAFISAGSTGAVMAASLFILRPLEGVDRPAIAIQLPAGTDPTRSAFGGCGTLILGGSQQLPLQQRVMKTERQLNPRLHRTQRPQSLRTKSLRCQTRLRGRRSYST